MRCEVGTHSTQPALVTKRMASAPQHKYVVRLTLEWITKLLRSVALVGPGRRAPAVEALGAQAVLLYMANFSAFELTQPQLLRFRWSPPWFLVVGAIAVVNRDRPGITRFTTTTVAIVFDATRVTTSFDHACTVRVHVLVYGASIEATVFELHVPHNRLERRKLITSR